MDLRVKRGSGCLIQARDWLFRGRRRLATLAVCLLLIPLGLRAIYGANGWLAYKQKQVEYRQLQQDLRQLQQEN
jgi:cell division protein FtsB